MDKSKSDPVVRDNKRLSLSSLSEALPAFLITMLVSVPSFILVLMPLALLGQVSSFGLRLFSRKPKKAVLKDPAHYVSLVQKTASENSEREYDMVLFGATGFTGTLAAQYIAKQYGNKSFKWAIAGRRRQALEDVKQKIIAIDADLKDLPVLLADSDDDDSLEALVRSTKVVITTAGPFHRYGSNLVRSCALFGTHYCDITGETDWVRQMIDQYDDAARKSGARIVSFCGHDCIPWDLLVLEASEELKKKGDVLSEISFFDELIIQPSGGTLETAFSIIKSRTVYKSFLGYDPLLKTASGMKSENKVVAKVQAGLSFHDRVKKWIGPFIMAAVNANAVRRSNALNGYSPVLVYREGMLFPSLFAGVVSLVDMLLFGAALMIPPFEWILRKFILPKPGEGPSKDDMDRGFLRVSAIGRGQSGKEVQGYIYFPTDPGYRDTARMLVESGLVLALQDDKVKVGGGLYTPAACQGRLLLDRLVNTGCSFAMHAQ